MSKSLLNLYLQKVAQGDPSCMEKLLGQLANRLVYIPLSSAGSEGGPVGGNVQVNVICVKEAHRSLIPVFTTEKALKSWCAKHGYSGESLSLLGSDLCTAVGAKGWLLINPDGENTVEMQPFMIEKMARIESQALTQPQIAPAADGVESERVLEEAPANIVKLEEPIQPEAMQPEAEQPLDKEEKEPAPKKTFLNFLKFR